MQVRRPGWLVAETRGQGGKVLHGVIALAIGAGTVSRMVPGASAQDEEGTGDVEPAVAAGTLDDGQTLLPLAGISLDAAVQAAQGATSGVVARSTWSTSAIVLSSTSTSVIRMSR